MRQVTDRRAEASSQGPAILIVGAWREGAFVPAEVLICADTLEAEEAVRRWLAGRAIHLTGSSTTDLPSPADSRPNAGVVCVRATSFPPRP